ncbi:MAG: hypothetical protein WC643_03135 [Parcubacteria group bacterium]|jgi:hypothetical protein
MKKSKILLIIVFLIVAAAVLYFAYGVVKKRYLPQVNNAGTKGNEMQNQTGNQSDSPTVDQSIGNQEENASDINNSDPGNGRPDVQSADCDNDCSQYKDNPDNLKYCQEVCGIRPATSKDSESQCENLTGIDKDSCWRDLAVSKKDFSFCDKISDAKLQKVCENRVTEEVLN